MAKNVVTNNRSICICLSCPVCKSIILISKGKKNDFKRISLLQKQSPGLFLKKVFLETSQNSWENIFAGVSSLIKLQA